MGELMSLTMKWMKAPVFKPFAVFAMLGMAGAVWAQADEERAKKIVGGVCFVCHGAEGESSSEVFPRLAGQYAVYVEAQLKQFNQRERTNDNEVMHSLVAKMTPLEMLAVAEYLSGK